MSSHRLICAACHREIDASARLCPFCSADPRPAPKQGTQAPAAQEAKGPPLTPTQRVVAHQRQGAVIAFGIAALVLALLALHQFISHRDNLSAANAAPLAEITDISPQPGSQPPPPMPDLQYRYDGNPQIMRTAIVEPGAVTPPEVIAAQQAAAKAAPSPQGTSVPSPAPQQPHR